MFSFSTRHSPLVVAMLVQFGIGGAIIPFVAILLRDRGLDFTQVSHVFLASSAMLLFFPFFWGMLADRFIPLNRLFTVLNILILAMLVLFAVQTSFVGILVAFMLFHACLNPSFILMNPLSFHHLKDPREEFAKLRAWGSFGWMIPSAVVYAVLLNSPSGNLDICLYLAMGWAVCMIGVTFWLPHTPTGVVHATPGQSSGPTYLQAMKTLMKDVHYLTVLVVFFLVASSFAIQAIYSPPLLEDMGLDRKWIGPSQCIGVILEIILFRWRSLFLNRLSIARTILVGTVALAIRHLIFTFSDNLTVLVLSHLLTGMVIVFHHIGASILVNAIAAREVRSTAQTLMVLFGSGLGPMFANASVGWITRATGQNLRAVFLFASVLAVAGSLLLLWRGKKLNEAARGV